MANRQRDRRATVTTQTCMNFDHLDKYSESSPTQTVLYFISIFHWLIKIRKNLQIGNFGSFRTFCSSPQINTTSAPVPDWRRIGSNPTQIGFNSMTYITAGSVPDEITQIHLIGPQYLKIESFYSAV